MDRGRRLLAAAALGLASIGASLLAACGLDAEGTCAGPACVDATTGPDSTIDVTVDVRRDARDAADAADARDARPPSDGEARDVDAATDHTTPCMGPTDCPPGEACNTATGKCSGSCSSGSPCNGGCCGDAGLCVKGDSRTACGNTGAACSACPESASNCADGICTASCDAGGCGAGLCCSSDGGACIMGNMPTACGSMAPCVSCVGNPFGSVCLGTNVCGCNAPTDCPLPGYSCSSSHECTRTCTGTGMGACNLGCCSDGGVCVPGNEPSACGTTGSCSTCGPPSGFLCLDGGTCGCATELDCDAGNACNPMGKCSPSCGGGASPCNDGCCDPMGSMCQSGDASAACGVSGGSCHACPMNGSACFSDGGCGCVTSADCQPGNACNGGVCSATCSATSPCNGGCCDTASSTCQMGNTDTLCAAGGGFTGACIDCTAGCFFGPTCLPASGGAFYCGCSSSMDCSGDSHCGPGQQTCNAAAMGTMLCGL